MTRIVKCNYNTEIKTNLVEDRRHMKFETDV